MPVAPAFELDVPSPNDTFFVNGEKAISASAALGGALGRTSYFFSTWTDLEGGEYVLRVYAHQASTWATSITRNNPRIFLNTPRSADPHIATVSLPRGRQRIDIMVSNVSAGMGSCYFAFSLWRQGRLVYSSEAASWVFDTEPVPDADLVPPSDPRLVTPVFSVQPNWANPVIERLQYATEILDSESDEEQRRSLRSVPRRSFEMSFARHTSVRSRIDTFLGGIGRNKFLLPLWHEQVILSETLTDSLSITDGSLSMREFRAGDAVLVTGRDPAIYEVLLIENVATETGLISFLFAPSGSWGAGDKVFPLREARVSESGAIDNLTDSAGTTSIRFELEDDAQSWFTPSWGNCSPTWGFQFDRGQQISVVHNRPTAFVVNDEYGPVDVYDLDQKTRLNVRGALTLFGREKVFAFRQFIDMARGRAVRFWMPSFTSDVQPVTGTSGTTLDIKSIGITDYMRSEQAYRNMVRLEFNDGNSPANAEVAAVDRVSDTVERITLASPFPVATADQISRVSFFLPVRFDQDLFELQHMVDNYAAVRTSVVLRTSDLDGMPSIECGLTSKLYPVEMVDGITPTVTISSVLIGLPWIEALDTTFAIASGSVVDLVFKQITPAPEAVDVTLTIAGGLVVPIVFNETTMPTEALDCSFIIANVQIARALIKHTQPPDAIDVSLTINGGAIT